MKNNKVLAVTNIILGGLLTIIPISVLLTVVPKIQETYRQFDINFNLFTTYVSLGSPVILGFTAIFLGIKLRQPNEKNSETVRYAKIALILSILTLVLGLPLIGVTTVLMPMYNLTNNIH